MVLGKVAEMCLDSYEQIIASRFNLLVALCVGAEVDPSALSHGVITTSLLEDMVTVGYATDPDNTVRILMLLQDLNALEDRLKMIYTRGGNDWDELISYYWDNR